jgi:D-psicose/D-tagatose/L-ribulose 3-epimerase
MGFRIALCNEVVRTLPFAAQCDFARACGYDGIELAPFTVFDAPHAIPASQVAGLRHDAAAAGVAISGLHWLLVAPAGLSLASEDAAVRLRTREVMLRLIDLCAALGGAYLVHGSPAQRRLPPDVPAARGWVEEAFLQAGTAAAAAGVTYLIEPLAPALTNCFNTVAEAAAFVQRAGLPALRTMFDNCAAAQAEDEPPETLLAHWLPTGLLAHVHLNDANQRGPGQGAQRFAPVLRALRDYGYSGWIGVEPFDYVPDGPACAARAIGYLRGIEESLT